MPRKSRAGAHLPEQTQRNAAPGARYWAGVDMPQAHKRRRVHHNRPQLTEASMIVRSYMTPDPIAMRSDGECRRALAVMQEQGIHHLPVLGPGESLVGILAERDLLLASLNYPGSSVEVSEVMHRDVVTVRDDMPVTHAASLMARRAIGGLPVVDARGRLVGIITERDILRAFVAVLESKTAREGDAAQADPAMAYTMDGPPPSAPAVKASRRGSASPVKKVKSGPPPAKTARAKTARARART
jgi:acetoin utilization protein AcuB